MSSWKFFCLTNTSHVRIYMTFKDLISSTNFSVIFCHTPKIYTSIPRFYVNAPRRHSLFDSAAAAGCGTTVVVMIVVVGEGRRVVVLAACLGAVRVKPCSNPEPLVKNLHQFPHDAAILLLSVKSSKLFYSILSRIYRREVREKREGCEKKQDWH